MSNYDNKSIPDIRFKGYEEPWEKRKFGDVVNLERGLTYKPSDIDNNGFHVLRSSNIDENMFVFRADDVFVRETSVTIPMARHNDILITAANGSNKLVGKHALIKVDPNYKCVPGGFMLIGRADNSEFINASMSSSWYSHFLSLYVAGGNGAIGNLKQSDLAGQEFLIPKEEEQSALGMFCSQLDNSIAFQQQKLEALKGIKSHLLSLMFCSAGQSYPVVRFSGYTDPWEQRKLDQVVSFYSGLTYKPDDVQGNGTLVLRSSNVKNDSIVDADNVYVPNEIATSEQVRVGDIIVVVRNGSRDLIGKHAQIKEEMPNTVIGAFMTGIRSEHPGFVNSLLSTSDFQDEVNKNMGSTINQITGYMFANMKFAFPKSEEQQQIGQFFQKLDETITLHQRKLQKLKDIKEALLNDMFV